MISNKMVDSIVEVKVLKEEGVVDQEVPDKMLLTPIKHLNEERGMIEQTMLSVVAVFVEILFFVELVIKVIQSDEMQGEIDITWKEDFTRGVVVVTAVAAVLASHEETASPGGRKIAVPVAPEWVEAEAVVILEGIAVAVTPEGIASPNERAAVTAPHEETASLGGRVTAVTVIPEGIAAAVAVIPEGIAAAVAVIPEGVTSLNERVAVIAHREKMATQSKIASDGIAVTLEPPPPPNVLVAVIATPVMIISLRKYPVVIVLITVTAKETMSSTIAILLQTCTTRVMIVTAAPVAHA